MIDIFYDSLFNRKLCRWINRLYGSEYAIFVVRSFIQRRNIASLDFSQSMNGFPSSAGFIFCFPFFYDFNHFLNGFFWLADKKHIDKISHRLSIINTGASGNNNRILICAVFGKHWDSRQIDHIEDVGVTHFIGHCKTKNVKVFNRRFGFQCIERYISFSHHFFHINPWCIDSFSQGIFSGVDDAVNDFQP